MIELGMHTDNWRTLSDGFRTAVASAVRHGLSHIEFGVIHGRCFVQGLGYDPAVSSPIPGPSAATWTGAA